MKVETASSPVDPSPPGSAPYAEKWSLHPGEALRRKRGLSAKEQQARAKHPVVLPQEVFESRALRRKSGSWTRGVQPDYTISIWPADYRDSAEAEEKEAIVHIHFDAKYRVESVAGLFGTGADKEVIHDRTQTPQENGTAAKYADLLKMHAYRDAIRCSGGAYVLYPGNAGDGQQFAQFGGFHEVLPGLGAFAVRPRNDGTGEGMDELRTFLDEVVEHLANRTTARERVSFHIGESYMLNEDPVSPGTLALPERDSLGGDYRAPPPAEHHVVVAWYDSPEQLAWTQRRGIAIVRLGKRRGAWHVAPEFASARHLLLRTYRRVIAPGLLRVRVPGYQVFTSEELRHRDYPGPAGGAIYAVFEVEEDRRYTGIQWNGALLVKVIEKYEARLKHRPPVPLGRTSAYPRVLSLGELLKALT